MKLATFLISRTRRIFTKLLCVSESSIKIKVKVTLDTFHGFAYFSNYLQKTSVWKQDCAISSKLQMLCWARPF